MKARVKISNINIDAEITADDPALQEAAARIVENANERIEHAIAEAVKRELQAILPGLDCTTTSYGWEDDDE